MALSVAAAALSKNATRIGANISKRLTRLASKDVQGGDILIGRLKAELEEIRAMPVTNYREAQAKEARMRRLDKAAGTRDRSFQKAAKRAHNDDLVERAKDPNNIIRMTKDELSEVFSIQRSRLRDRVRSVKKAINGNNYMTHLAEDLLDEYDHKTADHNKLRSLVGRSSKYLSTKTLTVQGANDHIVKGVALVGEQYRTWSDAQRTAFWEAVHRERELSGLSSVEGIEVVKTVMNDQKMKVLFDTAPDGQLRAVINRTLSGAEANQARLRIRDKKARNYLKQGFEKHGVKPPDSILSFLYGDDEEREYKF